MDTKDEPQSWNDALDKDDLTTAYMVGYHKRDDEVRLLRAEVERLREALIGLFSALDDCDTADDIAKSDDAAFRRLVRKAHAKRWAYATTDGYTVTPLHHPRQDAD